MAIRPSVPEIITVNSETLQTQIRDLLPSQNGFGSELQATNVITPIIDLTAAAEGATTPLYQQQAIAFGSQTAFSVSNSSAVIANSPGFYLISGVSAISQAANCVNQVSMTDGLAVKKVWAHQTAAASGNHAVEISLVVFLAAGESVSVNSNNPNADMSGSIRQLATADGSIVEPSGFPA